MKLPRIQDPRKYVDLFVIDFGQGQVAVGYTAEEVEQIVEQEAYRDVRVYRIHNADPSGRMELVGVPRSRFSLEGGMFFGQEQLSPARADYEQLRRLLEDEAPPGRCRLVLGHCPTWRQPYQTGLIYPAECDPAMARYLLAHEYRGGLNVAGGVGVVEEFYRDGRVLESVGAQAASTRRPRDWEQIKAAIGQAIQR